MVGFSDMSDMDYRTHTHCEPFNVFTDIPVMMKHLFESTFAEKVTCVDQRKLLAKLVVKQTMEPTALN